MRLARALLCTLIFVHVTSIVLAQKRLVDYAVSENWPILHPEAISNDGKYTLYTIAISSKRADPRWIVQSTDRSWKKEFLGIRDFAFTQDSRSLIFLTNSDSLGILSLDKDSIRYFTQISSFKLPSGGDGRWLSFLFNEPTGALVLFDLLGGGERKYPDVKDYLFDDMGKILLLQTAGKNDSIGSRTITRINLANGTASVIGHYLMAGNFVFNDANNQLAFLANVVIDGGAATVIKLYKIGMDSALTIVDTATTGMDGRKIKKEDIHFSKEGDKLFFRIDKQDPDIQQGYVEGSSEISIRNYQIDTLLGQPNKGILAVVKLNGPAKVITLGRDSDFDPLQLDENGNEDFGLIETVPKAKPDLYNPKDQARRDLYLVAAKDGSRKLIKGNALLRNISLSLTGKYAIWYDMEKMQWATYRMSNGYTNIITGRIPTALYIDDDNPNGLFSAEGMAGWVEDDKAVLIYDRYDIWQVDPDGVQAPVNITSAFGRRNNIRLRYMDFIKKPFEAFNTKRPVPSHSNDTLLLSAFNVMTKESGFFSLRMGRDKELRKLVLGEDTYYYPYRLKSPTILGMYSPLIPLKSKLANGFIVQRMNVNKYPNLYFTANFKDFRPLTDLAPQENYLWYNSELIHFTLPNGRLSEGVLYKPENFDPSRKYPVIFYYYERNADALHFFIHPELSTGTMSIPWFVSNGYLVFVPDIIYYKHGYPGECAYQSVNTAADVLSKKPWINARAMGLEGHSFGGWETNYIVTRTNRFAAAASSGGFSDFVSCNSQYFGSRKPYFEMGQGRIGTSFWKHPELYIQNSPVFYTQRVSTPILLLHNRDDSSVPFTQAMEWFNSLSRLHKKVWLLTYTGEDHGLDQETHQLDFSIRLAQFFDHYLKGLPAPSWMAGN